MLLFFSIMTLVSIISLRVVSFCYRRHQGFNNQISGILQESLNLGITIFAGLTKPWRNVTVKLLLLSWQQILLTMSGRWLNCWTSRQKNLTAKLDQHQKSRTWKIDFDVAIASESTGTPTSRTEKIFMEVFGYPVVNRKGELRFVVLQQYYNHQICITCAGSWTLES